MRRDRHWLAVIVAPLGVLPAAACALGVAFLINPDTLDGGLVLSCLVAFYGLPLSYLTTALLGMPAAWLLWRSGHRSLIATVAIGATIGSGVAAIPLGTKVLDHLGRNPGSVLGATNMSSVTFAVGLFGLCGAFVSALYWLVGLNRAQHGTQRGDA